MSLRELYQEMIIDHGKTPRNFGALANATHHKHGHNPLCGDKLTVYLHTENDVVTDVRFEGTGCAISVASASLMTETLKQKSLTEVNDLFEHFHQLVTTGKDSEVEMGKLAVFGGVAEFPVRVKCATLAWHTMKAALQQDVVVVSTE
jgi:nitrogen fixation protein NifU and related proteins